MLTKREWKFGNGGSAEPYWEVGKVRGVGETENGVWDLRAGNGSEGMGKRVLVRKGEKRESQWPK
jgi:hypothetical protein